MFEQGIKVPNKGEAGNFEATIWKSLALNSKASGASMCVEEVRECSGGGCNVHQARLVGKCSANACGRLTRHHGISTAQRKACRCCGKGLTPPL